MTTGVYWGRFNPPHKGHIKMLQEFLGRVDRVIVAIGRCQASRTKQDPFSGEERQQLWEAYLDETGVDRSRIDFVLVQEHGDYLDSVKRLLATLPRFDVLFADKEQVKEAMNRLGKGGMIAPFEREGEVSATMLRDAIAHDHEWTSLTGASVAALIKELGGVARIKEAYIREPI